MAANSETIVVPKNYRLREFVESRAFNAFVTAVIIVNAITLGLETSPAMIASIGTMLHVADTAALWIFTAELLLKLHVYRGRFFRDGWNVFDFAIVTIAWIPAAGPLSVLRALRIMRILRLVSIVPSMRKVVGALFGALPGMGSIVLVLMLVFYIAAVMATNLFGEHFPDFFGNVGASMFSLFQIMTLESWSMGIVRPVMDVYPHAWAFFVPFIIVTSFTVLNLFIALIVNSMQSLNAETADEIHEEAEIAHDEREALSRQISELSDEIRKLRRQVAQDS
jgi:voltage-gated sodium channel